MCHTIPQLSLDYPTLPQPRLTTTYPSSCCTYGPTSTSIATAGERSAPLVNIAMDARIYLILYTFRFLCALHTNHALPRFRSDFGIVKFRSSSPL